MTESLSKSDGVIAYLYSRIEVITGTISKADDSLSTSGIDSIGIVELAFDLNEEYGFTLEDSHLDVPLCRLAYVIVDHAPE